MSALNNNNTNTNNSINEGAVEHGTLESGANQRGVSTTLPETSVGSTVERQAESEEDPDMVPPKDDEQEEVLASDTVGAARYAGCLSQGIPRIFTLRNPAEQWAALGTGHRGEPTGRSCRRSIPHDRATEVLGAGPNARGAEHQRQIWRSDNGSEARIPEEILP